MTKNHDGTNFNWHDVVGDLIDIRCCKKKPDARLRVKYCGYWFYIDNCDHVSKRTLLMMMYIMEFSNVESKSRQPALTLPL